MKKMQIVVYFLFTGLLLVGCGSAPEEVVESAAALTPTPIEDELPPEVAQPGALRQWAVAAQASTEYADPEWAAIQATGAPNTARCGDYQTAWTSSGSDTLDWLEVEFEQPVYVTAVNIVQTFNPNQVSKVELIDNFGRVLTVYDAAPFQIDQPCPYTLAIQLEKTPRMYASLRITIDQSVLGLGWNEIDAVELVGDQE